MSRTQSYGIHLFREYKFPDSNYRKCAQHESTNFLQKRVFERSNTRLNTKLNA